MASESHLCCEMLLNSAGCEFRRDGGIFSENKHAKKFSGRYLVICCNSKCLCKSGC